MTNNELGPRPSNPADISFDRRCFTQTGTRTEYSVARSSLHSGPAQFGTNREAAEAFARRTNRSVTATQVAVMERVSWR